MKSYITLVLVFMFSNGFLYSQACLNSIDFSSLSLGILSDYTFNGMSGYYNGYGSPFVGEEQCPVGEPGRSICIQASVDDSLSDAVLYVSDSPFSSDRDYIISGHKLLIGLTVL